MPACAGILLFSGNCWELLLYLELLNWEEILASFLSAKSAQMCNCTKGLNSYLTLNVRKNKSQPPGKNHAQDK